MLAAEIKEHHLSAALAVLVGDRRATRGFTFRFMPLKVCQLSSTLFIARSPGPPAAAPCLFLPANQLAAVGGCAVGGDTFRGLHPRRHTAVEWQKSLIASLAVLHLTGHRGRLCPVVSSVS